MIPNLNSKKFFFSSTLALGVLTGVGIATAPAQAADFTQASSLGWSNGTSDFVDDATDVFDNETGQFEVTFDPASAGSVALVSNATGDFAPYFTPGITYSTGSPTVSFQFLNLAPTEPGFEKNAEFALVGDLEFEFNPTNSSSPVTMTLEDGTKFVGGLETDGGIEFALEGQEEWTALLEDAIDGDTNITGTAFSSSFTFDEAEAEGGGQYSGGGSFQESVPEPTSILGLLAIGGLGLGLKRKKQS